MIRILVALFATLSLSIAQELKEKGPAHLSMLANQPWLAEWKDAKLTDIKLAEPKPDATWPTNLPAVWWGRISAAKGTGYMAWQAQGSGELVDFAFDADIEVNDRNARAIRGVPALQQFALDHVPSGKIASGCVPTSASSVLGFWHARGIRNWSAGDLKETTLRIRARLKMQAIPDADGFTDDGMTLAGANPFELARAIQADAEKHGVSLACKFGRFAFDQLVTEINDGRPVLLSCTVRLPHKPQLSWGHEVAGVGWAVIDGQRFAGVIDNFFPTRSPATVRWIREDSFDSLITVRPEKK